MQPAASTGPKTFQASVTTVAAAIKTGSAQSSRSGWGVLIKNLTSSAQTVWIGGDATVTSLTGYPLAPGDSVSIPTDDHARIFAVTASSTATLAVLYV